MVKTLTLFSNLLPLHNKEALEFSFFGQRVAYMVSFAFTVVYCCANNRKMKSDSFYFLTVLKHTEEGSFTRAIIYLGGRVDFGLFARK